MECLRHVFGRPTLLARLLIKIEGIAMADNRGNILYGKGERPDQGGGRLGTAE